MVFDWNNQRLMLFYNEYTYSKMIKDFRVNSSSLSITSPIYRTRSFIDLDGIKLLRNPGFSKKAFRTISPKLGRPVLALLICDTAQTELFKFQPFDAGNVTLLGKYDKSVFWMIY
jgi:hypothetical protein